MKLQINQHALGVFQMLVLLFISLLATNSHAQEVTLAEKQIVTQYNDTGQSGTVLSNCNKAPDRVSALSYQFFHYQSHDPIVTYATAYSDTGGAGTATMSTGNGNKKLDVTVNTVTNESSGNLLSVCRTFDCTFADDSDTGGQTAVGSSSSTAGNKKLDCRLS